jgi:hypothetical protein
VDLRAGDAVLFGVGQHGADLDQRLVGGTRHGGTTKGAHHARAGDQRDDLVTRKHQRRKVETLPHHVANARLAVDRHPGRLQVGNVAVDGSLGNLEPGTELLGGDQPATAQMLHDLEEPVGTAHRMVPRLRFYECRGPQTGSGRHPLWFQSFALALRGDEFRAEGQFLRRRRVGVEHAPERRNR